MSDIKVKMFGYNRKQVDNYLVRLRDLHKNELADLRNKAAKCQQERSDLLDWLARLQDKGKTMLETKDLLRLALSRVDDSVTLIGGSASGYVERLGQESSYRMAEYERTLAEIQESVGLREQQIASDLKGILELLDKREAGLGTKDRPQTDNILPILPFLKRKSPAAKEQEAGEKGSPAREPAVESAVGMAADGTGLPSRLPNRETGAKSPPGRDSQRPAGLYWDAGFDSFWDGVDRDPQDAGTAEPVDVPSSEAPGWLTEDDQVAASGEPGPGPSLQGEISAFRYKYVVGKLAGEDLLDSRGEVIIARNEPITPAAVDRAAREGKLPDLIVHMVMPGAWE